MLLSSLTRFEFQLKRGHWRLMTWEVWKGQSGWWWDGCVGCPWKTESAVRIYATFLVLIVLLMWWGMEDWDGLDIWSVRVWMTWVSACRGLMVEGTRGRGRSRKTWEQCVRDDMKLLGLHNKWAWKNGRFKNQWWWWWWWCWKSSSTYHEMHLLL